MTIYSIIDRNLKWLLAVSLLLTALSVVVFAFLSFDKVQSQAFQFASVHLVALAQDGVNTQNVHEIDKEVGRFVQAWTSTQKLDLRVDVFIDDRMVAHAGQMQSYQHFVSSREEIITLDSGQALKISLQIHFADYLLWNLGLFAGICACILILFHSLRVVMRRSIRNVTDPLDELVQWIKELAFNLPQSAHSIFSPAKSKIEEVSDLTKSIESLMGEILSLEDKIAKINKDKIRVKVIEEIAHNIKGIIGTIQLKIESLQDLSESQKIDLRSSLNQLREISSGALNGCHKPAVKKEFASTAVGTHVLPALRLLIKSKKHQFPRASLQLEKEIESFGVFVDFDLSKLQSVVATAIDNSIEATADKGEISVKFEKIDGFLKIEIADNGPGIAEEHLARIFKGRFTHGKEKGNGIGLSHALDVVSSAGGNIEIESKVGSGTTVVVSLPMVHNSWFLKELDLQSTSEIVIVDDDWLIPKVWDLRLSDCKGAAPTIIHIPGVQEFNTWFAENGQKNFGQRTYVFDYDLKDRSSTGLDLIEQNGLALESLFISGVADEPEIRLRSQKLGVPSLSKDFLEIVPIKLRNQTAEGKGLQQVT